MLATYDARRNTQLGLELGNRRLPLLRIYRRDDPSYFAERRLTSSSKSVLHFIIDHSSEEIYLPDEFEAYFQDL